MILAVDFDGTLCTHEFPNIGKIYQEVFDAVLKAKKDGHKIILWTCREGEYLKQAVEWCEVRGLVFDAVNENVDKEGCRRGGFAQRKIFAHLYLDDRNVSISKFLNPLSVDDNVHL